MADMALTAAATIARATVSAGAATIAIARDAGPDSIISVADAMVIATTTATAGGAERRPQHQCAPLSILCEADALG